MEWVASLANQGTTNTPLLEDIQALDDALPVPLRGEATLHWAKGGVASFDDFAPQTTVLKAGEKRRFHPGGGRSSNEVLPFFNLQGADGGVVAAVGWSGEWAAEFACDPRGQVSLKAGLARTHLRLFPGESIRTPRILLLFYQGDRWRGQNLLRQFILAHHRPMRGGQPLLAPITCGNWGGTRAEVHLDNIRKFIQHQLPIEYYWIDAEWYGQGDWASNVGNWRVKPDLYPAGFKPLSDALRASGRELMLWFEPERVIKGTEWQQGAPRLDVRYAAATRSSSTLATRRRASSSLTLSRTESPSSAWAAIARISTWSPCPTGTPPMLPTARAWPRASTSKGSMRSGTSC